MKAFASLRSPIMSPNGEVRVSEERELVIGQWPEIVVPAPTTVAPEVKQSHSQPPTHTAAGGGAAAVGGAGGAAAGGAPKPSKTVDFSCLSAAEKEDPLNVKWLQSSDVLTAEVEVLAGEAARVGAALQALRGGPRSEQSEEEEEELEMREGELQNRQFVVESALSVLVHQVSDTWHCRIQTTIDNTQQHVHVLS